MAILVPIYAENKKVKFDERVIDQRIIDVEEDYIESFDYMGGLWFNWHNTENYAKARDAIKDVCYEYGTLVYRLVTREFLLDIIKEMEMDSPENVMDVRKNIEKTKSDKFLISFMP